MPVVNTQPNRQAPQANWAINQAIPGLEGMTRSATGIINNALQGLPSASESRLSNAYFGAQSGLDPTSDFLRNRGYDLYKRNANQFQRQGVQDLLSLVGGYSGTVAPTPGQEIGAQQASADRGQRAAEFNSTMGFEREQYQKQLELLQKYLGNPAGGTGTFGVQAYGFGTDPYGNSAFAKIPGVDY